MSPIFLVIFCGLVCTGLAATSDQSQDESCQSTQSSIRKVLLQQERRLLQSVSAHKARALSQPDGSEAPPATADQSAAPAAEPAANAPQQEAPGAPQGAPAAPEQGAPAAPEQGAPAATEQGAPAAPEQGAPAAPEQGTAPAAPEQGAQDASQQAAPTDQQQPADAAAAPQEPAAQEASETTGDNAESTDGSKSGNPLNETSSESEEKPEGGPKEEPFLSDAGFKQVAAENDDKAMLRYVKRVAEYVGMQETPKSDGCLLKVSGKYIGAEAPVFKDLVQEIISNKKLTSVVSVQKDGEPPLTENGYKFVVQKQDNTSMAKFIQDVAKETGYKVTDEAAVLGAAPFYSGYQALQSFARLQEELKEVSEKADGWVVKSKSKSKKSKTEESAKKADALMEKAKEKSDAKQQGEDEGQAKAEDEADGQAKAEGEVEGQAKAEGEAEAPAKKEEAASAEKEEAAPGKEKKATEEKEATPAQAEGEAAPAQAEAAPATQEETAPASQEEGAPANQEEQAPTNREEAAPASQEQEMAAAAKTEEAVKKEADTKKDKKQEMNGDGEESKKEDKKADGEQAKKADEKESKKEDKKDSKEQEAAPAAGEAAPQETAAPQDSTAPVPAPPASLASTDKKADASKKQKEDTHSLLSAGTRKHVHKPSKSDAKKKDGKPEEKDDKMPLEEVAPFNSDGFKEVVALSKRSAMSTYLHRLVDSLGLVIMNGEGMDKLDVLVKGKAKKVTFKDTVNQLLQESAQRKWIKSRIQPRPGDKAPLDDDGYIAVVQMQHNKMMELFIKRVVEDSKLKLVDGAEGKGGIAGMAPYYSGEVGFQDFKALRAEIKEKSKEAKWLQRSAK